MAVSPIKRLPYQSVLEKHPRYLRAIGLITVELSNLDIMLADVLSALLAIHVKYGRAVYLAPRSSSARLSILNDVAEAIFQEKSPAIRKINSLIKRSRGLHTRRDKLIHGLWGRIKNRVHQRNIPMRDSEPPRPMKLKNLTDFIHEIRLLIEEIIDVEDQIRTADSMNTLHGRGAVRNVVGIRCGAISGNMKVSFQAARSIG